MLQQIQKSSNVRLNRIVHLLERKQRVFGTFAAPGNIDEAQAISMLGYDFVVFEMEHSGFDYPGLRTSLQFLVDRSLEGFGRGEVLPLVPMARLPTKASELTPWIVKQALDTGLLGIALPHLTTVEEARNAVEACRYATPAVPNGNRGWGPFRAARYLGKSLDDYTARADLWPLNDEGDLFLMPLVESKLGVKNLDEILAEVKGIGAIFFGAGDLSVELGVPGDMTHPLVLEAMLQVRDTCRKHGVATAVLTDATHVEERVDQGFEIIITLPSYSDPALIRGRQAASGSRQK